MMWFARLGVVVAAVAAAITPAQAAGNLEHQTIRVVEVPREYRLDGTVEAVNQSTVSAQTSGQVEEILFDVDDLSLIHI